MQTAVAQTWDFAEAGSSRWVLRIFPSLTDFAFLLPAFLMFVMLSGAGMLLGDGDTGWHIRTGDWILQHWAVPKIDLFSFTESGKPWFAWEWGWDVIFALVHRSFGLAGVAFVNVVLLGIISVLAFRLIRRYTDNDILSLALTLLAVCGSMIHWLARPHLVSWSFTLIFCHLLLSSQEGKIQRLYWLPILTVVWTNLHGGFFIGIGLIGVALVDEFAAAIENKASLRTGWQRCSPYVICAAGCVAATFVNPYTWHLHQHVISYLRDARLLDNITEYQSISFHHGAAIFFEIMLLLACGAGFWCLKNRRIGMGLTVLAWGHLALLSGRNIPIFMLFAAAPTALMIQSVFGQLKRHSLLAGLAATLEEIRQEFQPMERIERLHLTSLAVILLIAACFAARVSGFPDHFERKRFPVDAPALLEYYGAARVFTYDQWADYLIYQSQSKRKAFMDGRSDFYGADFVTVYQHIISARYDCETELDHYKIDTVLLRPEEALATVLKLSPRWQQVFDNGSIAVFRRLGLRESAGSESLRASSQTSPVACDGRNTQCRL